MCTLLLPIVHYLLQQTELLRKCKYSLPFNSMSDTASDKPNLKKKKNTTVLLYFVLESNHDASLPQSLLNPLRYPASHHRPSSTCSNPLACWQCCRWSLSKISDCHNISLTRVTIKDKVYHDTLDPILEQSHLSASLWRWQHHSISSGGDLTSQSRVFGKQPQPWLCLRWWQW